MRVDSLCGQKNPYTILFSTVAIKKYKYRLTIIDKILFLNGNSMFYLLIIQ